MYEGEEIPEGIFSEAFPTPPEASIYPPWRRGHMLQRCVEACYAEAHREEGEVHLDSYNGQGAWRPWSFSLTEDDEDLLTDEDAMSQDEEEQQL